ARNGAVAAFRFVEAVRAPFDDSDLLAEIADTLWSEGHVIKALNAYERLISTRPNDDDLRARREKALGLAMFLLDGWDALCADTVELFAPDAQRFLWLVAEAFPYTRSQASINRHARACGLLASGWRPTVVTLLPQPWNLDVGDITLSENID